MAEGTVTVSHLLEVGLIRAGERIIMRRRNGPPREATVRPDGTIALADGQICRTPSEAAKEAAGVGSADGWIKWRVPRLANRTLDELRHEVR